MHLTRLKKNVLSRLHLHESNYMTFWKRQNYRDNKISKKKNIEILREIKIILIVAGVRDE